MKLLDGFEFWKQIDFLLNKNHLTNLDLSDKAGIVYRTVTTQRNRHSIPNGEQLLRMAKTLNVSIEYLLTGKEDPFCLSQEAAEVQKDENLQAIVRSILEDRNLIPAVLAYISTYEQKMRPVLRFLEDCD